MNGSHLPRPHSVGLSVTGDATTAFAAVAKALATEPDVGHGTGFGTNPGLRTHGKIFAMLIDEELVVKLPAKRCVDMVAAGSARFFEVGRRQMREWVRIPDADQANWEQLAVQARDYVASERGGARKKTYPTPPEGK